MTPTKPGISLGNRSVLVAASFDTHSGLLCLHTPAPTYPFYSRMSEEAYHVGTPQTRKHYDHKRVLEQILYPRPSLAFYVPSVIFMRLAESLETMAVEAR